MHQLMRADHQAIGELAGRRANAVFTPRGESARRRQRRRHAASRRARARETRSRPSARPRRPRCGGTEAKQGAGANRARRAGRGRPGTARTEAGSRQHRRRHRPRTRAPEPAARTRPSPRPTRPRGEGTQSVTPPEVKALRDRTGAGMMDAKRRSRRATALRPGLEDAPRQARQDHARSFRPRGRRGHRQSTSTPTARSACWSRSNAYGLRRAHEDFVAFAKGTWRCPVAGARPSSGCPTRRPEEGQGAERRVYEQKAAESRRTSGPRSRGQARQVARRRACCCPEARHADKARGRRPSRKLARAVGEGRRDVVIRRFVRFMWGLAVESAVRTQTPRVQAHPAHALRRGAVGALDTEPNPGADQDRCRAGPRRVQQRGVEGGDRWSAPATSTAGMGARRRHGPSHSRLHWACGDGAQRASRSRTRLRSRVDPRVQSAIPISEVEEAPKAGARDRTRAGSRGDLRGRDREPVLHDRHAAALRDVERTAEAMHDGEETRRGVYNRRPGEDPTDGVLEEITVNGRDPAPA